MDAEKRCFKCGEVKRLAEFYKHREMADGHLNKCKECTKRERREHAELHPEKILESRMKTTAKNPTKYNAYRAFEAGLMAGVISKAHNCSMCGMSDSEARMEAHHHDYSKPLDVVWLCPKCHAEADKRKRIRDGNPVTSLAKKVCMLDGDETVCTFNSIAEAADAIGIAASSLSVRLKHGTAVVGKHRLAYGGEN